MNYKTQNEICIFIEHTNGKLSPYTNNLIKIANDLKNQVKNGFLSAIIIGNFSNDTIEQLSNYPIDRILSFYEPVLNLFQEDSTAHYLNQILLEIKPEIFIGNGTVLGRSLFPRVATKLGTGLTADCTKLSISKESGLLLQTRPAFNGNLMATITTKTTRPQMVTIRPIKSNSSLNIRKNVQVVKFDFDLFESKITILNPSIRSDVTEKLSNAEIVIGVGMGIKTPNNLGLVYDLAKKLNASICGTRAVVDAGWLAAEYQVGQTGYHISPKLYIACGISGAIQHRIGIAESSKVFAINTDAEAPIFTFANHGIVGDFKDIIPDLISKI